MTIQEAIKSGRKVKRPLDTHYHTDFRYLSIEDILATDWEIEIVKKELSAEDIRNAYYEALRLKETGTAHTVTILLRLLGLE